MDLDRDNLSRRPPLHLQVLNTQGIMVEDILISDVEMWTAEDNIAAAASVADGLFAYVVSSESHQIYSIELAEPHRVSHTALDMHSGAVPVA